MEAVKKFVAERGIRSRPWLKYAILTHDDQDRSKVLAEVEEPRIVQTLDGFLTTHSHVTREDSCPGW